MKTIIQENKGVIRFILIFLISYIIFSILYSLYLSSAEGLDLYTNWVADQTVWILNAIDYNTTGEVHSIEKRMKLFTNGVFVAFIMEGCNAISVQILFISFVIAFAKKIRVTILFVLIGLVFIYLINILRIVLLTVLIYHRPEWTGILHSVIFPGIIYGAVFLLWVYWVRYIQKSSNYER